MQRDGTRANRREGAAPSRAGSERERYQKSASCSQCSPGAAGHMIRTAMPRISPWSHFDAVIHSRIFMADQQSMSVMSASETMYLHDRK